MIFFVDRNFGKHKFPDRLRAAGIPIQVHDDFFSSTTTDDVWIVEVTRMGLICVTLDRRIKFREVEKKAVIQAGARMIALSGGNASMDDLAQNFINSQRKIANFVNKTTPPFIAVLSKASDVDFAAGKPGRLRQAFP